MHIAHCYAGIYNKFPNDFFSGSDAFSLVTIMGYRHVINSLNQEKQNMSADRHLDGHKYADVHTD